MRKWVIVTAVLALMACGTATDLPVQTSTSTPPLGGLPLTSLTSLPPPDSFPSPPPVVVIPQASKLIATQVSAGGPSSHSCVVVSGTIRCWGRNDRGQLGTGTTVNSATPVLVSGVTTAIAVSAGLSSYTCTVLAARTAQCWGGNDWGQLGDGTRTDSKVPVTVPDLTSVTAIAPGVDHTCARLSDGTVKCWGSNLYGQLGTVVPQTAAFLQSHVTFVPVAVPGLSGVTAIAAGNVFTCALQSNGEVVCWGAKGGLGAFAPALVSGISTATSISAFEYQACARLSDGTVKCWGNIRSSSPSGSWDTGLGDGSTAGSYTPVTVTGITTATAVTVGYAHTCLLLVDGSARCWGLNHRGQLGTGAFTAPETCSFSGLTSATICRRTPTPVAGLSGATAMGSGGAHTCVLKATGEVWCWGANEYGQLGTGTLTSMTSPALVSGF